MVIARLLTTKQVTDALGLSPSTLSRLRFRGIGPRYVRIGDMVRYNPADIERWIDANSVPPGNEPVHRKYNHRKNVIKDEV
jgi:predicted DNA-binding transcriptional regulator AlpA